MPNELLSVVIRKIFSFHFLISAEHRKKKKTKQTKQNKKMGSSWNVLSHGLSHKRFVVEIKVSHQKP